MREPRELSSQAEAEIDELRRIGVKVTDSDVVLINALCWEIENPFTKAELSRGRPIKVGGAWLWPRTIAACDWFESVGCEMKDVQTAFAYAFAFGRGDIETATEADVKAWKKTLKCTSAELKEACGFVLMQEETDAIPTSKTDKQATLGQLVRTMHAIHGGEPAMWERYVSLAYVLEMLTTANAQAEAEGQDATKAMKARANLALAFALDNIQKRDKAEKQNG